MRTTLGVSLASCFMLTAGLAAADNPEARNAFLRHKALYSAESPTPAGEGHMLPAERTSSPWVNPERRNAVQRHRAITTTVKIGESSGHMLPARRAATDPVNPEVRSAVQRHSALRATTR